MFYEVESYTEPRATLHSRLGVGLQLKVQLISGLHPTQQVGVSDHPDEAAMMVGHGPLVEVPAVEQVHSTL